MKEEEENLVCVDCGQDPHTPLGGVIYIRVKVNNVWSAEPVCTACWDIRHPGRQSVFLKKEWEDDNNPGPE